MLSMLAFFFCLTVDWFGPLDVLQSMPCNFSIIILHYDLASRSCNFDVGGGVCSVFVSVLHVCQ